MIIGILGVAFLVILTAMIAHTVGWCKGWDDHKEDGYSPKDYDSGYEAGYSMGRLDGVMGRRPRV